MTAVIAIDKVTAWVQKNICEPVQLKEPPNNDKANDENYEYRRVTPACYSLFLPGEEKTAPQFIPQTPSVCVKVLAGEDNLTTNESTLTFELSFCAWDPGVYGRDILVPDKNDPFTFREWRGKESDKFLKIDGQGWRDVWNWIDTGLQSIRNTTEMNGIALDLETPVTYGPYADQDGIVDIFPYWLAWISFKAKMPIRKNINRIEELL